VCCEECMQRIVQWTDNSMRDEGAGFISEALKVNEALTRLQLKGMRELNSRNR